jgi:hypothetical protein
MTATLNRLTIVKDKKDADNAAGTTVEKSMVA